MLEEVFHLDPSVRRAMAKWPDVPAVYGWLRLDQRGRFLLRGRPVLHPHSQAFLGRNYARSKDGCYFVQNGPQRVFVALASTPWVLRWRGDQLVTHTDQTATAQGVWLDEEGSLYIDTEWGLGLVHDGELLDLATSLVDAQNDPLEEASLLAALAGDHSESFFLNLPQRRLGVSFCPRADLPQRFHFVRSTSADQSG